MSDAKFAPTQQYETSRWRTAWGITAGAAAGAALTLIWLASKSVALPSVDHLLGIAGIFALIFLIWLIFLIGFGLPLLWLLDKFGLRHWLVAMICGAVVPFVVTFAFQAQSILLRPAESVSFNHSGGVDYIFVRAWWPEAFQISLLFAIAGIVVALVVWRVAYRRVDDVPTLKKVDDVPEPKEDVPMFKEYDVVALKREVAGVPASVGTHGTIVLVHPASSRDYEVELFDGNHETIGETTYTLNEDDLVLVSPEPLPNKSE